MVGSSIYLENLEDYVCEQKQIVSLLNNVIYETYISYKWLAMNLSVPSTIAQRFAPE